MSITLIDKVISAAPERLKIVRSGWNYPEYLRDIITGYRATQNQEFLVKALELAAIMANSTDRDIGLVNALGDSGYAYSTKAYSYYKSHWLPNEAGAFNFVNSICAVLYECERAGLDYDKSIADKMRLVLLEEWPRFDNGFMWNTQAYPFKAESKRYDNSGRYDRSRLPLNMQALAASAFLNLSKVLEMQERSDYGLRDKWRIVHDYVLDNIEEREGQLFWLYWGDYRPDDWGHGSIVASYVMEAYHHTSAISQDYLRLLMAILDKHHNDNADYKYASTRIDGSIPWTEKNERYYPRFLSGFKRWSYGLALLGMPRGFMRNAIAETVGLGRVESLHLEGLGD